MKNPFVCEECKTYYQKWQGQCSSCFTWNSIVDYTGYSESVKNIANDVVSLKNNVTKESLDRLFTDVSEFDYVFGDGLVKGTVNLIGGTPGSGKSTLLLQIANSLAKQIKILYVSGEETTGQVSLRAKRLNIDSENILISNTCRIEDIKNALVTLDASFLIIDSIQTMTSSELNSLKGSVAQVK